MLNNRVIRDELTRYKMTRIFQLGTHLHTSITEQHLIRQSKTQLTIPRNSKHKMPSTLNVPEDAAEYALIKTVAAFELSIEANTAEMEASRMELMALHARARADEAKTEAIRLSAPYATSLLFSFRPEWGFLRQVALAALLARTGVQKLVRCFAQATLAARLGMDNEAADQMQDISAFDEVRDAVEMAVEAVIPVEHLCLTDRFDNEGHRSDIIRTARAILDYYAELPKPQFEDASRGAEEESGSEDIPIADAERIPMSDYGIFFRTIHNREEFDPAQIGGCLFGATGNRGVPSSSPSYLDSAARGPSGTTQNENSSLPEMREGHENRGFPSYSNSAERNNRVGRQRRPSPRMSEGRGADEHREILFNRNQEKFFERRESQGSVQRRPSPRMREGREADGHRELLFSRNRDNLFGRRESQGSVRSEANKFERRDISPKPLKMSLHYSGGD